jgi:hypothetical protein
VLEHGRKVLHNGACEHEDDHFCCPRLSSEEVQQLDEFVVGVDDRVEVEQISDATRPFVSS